MNKLLRPIAWLNHHTTLVREPSSAIGASITIYTTPRKKRKKAA